MLEIVLLDSADAFAHLEAEWQALVTQASAPVFLHPIWQRLWWQHQASNERLQIYTFRDAGVLVGLAPLMLLPTGELQIIGGLEVADYLDILAAPTREHEVAAALFNTLAARGGWSTLTLQDIPAASPTRAVVAALAKEHGWCHKDEVEETCPRVPLPESFEAYLESLPQHDRHELRRKMRKAANRRGFKYVTLTAAGTEPAVLQQAAEDFVALHILSNDDKATFMTDAMRAFFLDVVASGAALGVTLHFIEIGGRRVAALLNYHWGSELWGYNSGLDPEYAQFSVGVAIFGYTMEWAFTQGCTVFDFLRGAEPYKFDFGPTVTYVHRITVGRKVAVAGAAS